MVQPRAVDNFGLAPPTIFSCIRSRFMNINRIPRFPPRIQSNALGMRNSAVEAPLNCNFPLQDVMLSTHVKCVKIILIKMYHTEHGIILKLLMFLEWIKIYNHVASGRFNINCVKVGIYFFKNDSCDIFVIFDFLKWCWVAMKKYQKFTIWAKMYVKAFFSIECLVSSSI